MSDKPFPSPDHGAGVNTNVPKTYKEARLQNTENLRNLVVEAAAAILQEEGPEAVTVRRVAQQMDCSTKIIYSLFVNKEGLAQQLYLHGCRLLAYELDRAGSQAAAPAQHLLHLGEAIGILDSVTRITISSCSEAPLRTSNRTRRA
ncbi:TetR/AcrR family transcriptional regulator [Paenibacillus sp. y28]|uniref:TetR/AcrR family transcriptional regulator n=1 Tax=Paenibacillus sp. y28 TaxID=3129110 RepID=UPI003017055A